MRRVIALVCLMVCAESLAAVSSPESPAPPTPAPAIQFSPESRDRFASALSAFGERDWSAAAREFGNAGLATTPLGDYALLFQAQSQLRLGDVPAAGATASRVVAAAADGRLAPSAVLDLAAVLTSAGDDKSAVTVLGRFVDRHSDHPAAPRARLALGQALLADGHTAEAAKAFRELWLLFPATGEAQTAGEQLRVLADRGLGGPPVSPRERVERGERLVAAGLAESARTAAETLLADDLPVDLRARALKILLDVSRRASQWDAALATINRALVSMPETRRAPWLLDLARIQHRRAPDQALDTLDKVGRLYPKSAEAHEALSMKARYLEDAGRIRDAQAAYAKLAADHGEEEDGSTALWRLGWFAWFRGAYTEAATAWARVLTSRGGQSYREAATYWLARADELRGEREPAARRLAELKADVPRSYYGILAGQRSIRANPTQTQAPPIALPANPLEPLETDTGYIRVEALRAVGLGVFADEEMADMAQRAVGDPQRLYAWSAAYAQQSRWYLSLRILRRHFYSLARSGMDAIPRVFWDMFYPLGWRSELTEAASRAAIDPFFVAAVVREESSFHAQARSRVGARGLMQLMPDTARPMAQARGLAWRDGDVLDDPAANLDMGAAFLASLLRQFGDARLATAAYNAGPTRVREWWGARRSDDLEVWVEQIPFNETRAFVKRVMLSWDEYRRLYGAPAAVGLSEHSGSR